MLHSNNVLLVNAQWLDFDLMDDIEGMYNISV